MKHEKKNIYHDLYFFKKRKIEKYKIKLNVKLKKIFNDILKRKKTSIVNNK